VDSFWDISFGLGEEEEDLEEIHMSQNAVTTRSASKTSSSNPPTSYEVLETISNNQKETASNKHNTPSTPPSILDYDFPEYLKRPKENISLFELMKLPQIQENFIKTLQDNYFRSTHEANVGVLKGQGKADRNVKKTAPKRQ
jgi:hypothetical protein